MYQILLIFGKSLVSVEGQDFRRHRKVVGPSFSEKSNKLVFDESLRQAMGMMDYWASQGSNTIQDIKVQNAALDSAVLSLHVICAAGFGLPQTWQRDDQEKVKDQKLPSTHSMDVSDNQFLTFKQNMHDVLQGIRWLVAFPTWMLRNSPFKVHRSVQEAFTECVSYFEQLAEKKRQQIKLGEHDDSETSEWLYQSLW
jgi:cytochrome P450